MKEILNFYKYIDKGSLCLNECKLNSLAKKLMKEYCIKKQDVFYQIAEIEFYYYDRNHRDIITYPRNCSEGLWFFHQSGVDLTIKSSEEGENPCFGGILIRSIIKFDENGKIKIICGPQKCVNELFDVLNAIDNKNNLTPVFEKYDFGDIEVVSTQRYISFDVTAKDLKDGYGEKEKYQKVIVEKAKTKYNYILSENKKRVKTRNNKEWLIASDKENSFDAFKSYLKAKYRFYIKGIEWEKGYKAANIDSYKHILIS